MPLSFTTVHPWRRAGPRRAARTWGAWGLVGLLLVVGGVTLVILRSPVQHGPAVGSATLQVESLPAGAAIEIDGHPRGHTPATVTLPPGEHRVTLRHAEYAEASYHISVDPDQTTRLLAELWLRTPRVQRLRPPFPGATITDASFLHDGQVVLVVDVPPGGERQLWLLDERGTTRRLGPPAAQGSVAVAPDGSQIAYLARGQGSGSGGGRLSEVWIARGEEERGERRYALPADAADERLLDLSWDPTGRRLLIISRRQRPEGGQRSQLRLLDVARGESRELASLPSDVVPGSYSWSPTGDHLAFLARTDQVLALSLISTLDGTFHYLADLSRDSLNPASFPPLAWSPDGQRLVYAAPAQDRPISERRPFGAKSSFVLFAAERSQPLGQPLGEATADAPAWRQDGTIVALARPKRDGPLLLRAIEPDGEGRDLAELSLPPAATFAVRWDVVHAQAIVALPGLAGSAMNAPAYWLVRFRPEVGR